MPFKWKIYYWCSVYMLLWCVTVFCYSVYLFFSTLSSPTDILDFFVIAFVLLVMPFSAWQCILAIKHYQNNDPLSNRRKRLFQVGFISQILTTAVICLLCYLLINFHYFLMDDEGYEPEPWLDYKRVVPDFLSLLMAIASLYTLFLHLPLLKAIGQNQHGNTDGQLQ
jgi:hypothetical protein